MSAASGGPETRRHPGHHDPSVPDLTSYRAVHHAIRRSAHRLAAVAHQIPVTERRRTAASLRYWNGYRGEIVAHHTLEDDTFFPALAERSPAMVDLHGRLGADHDELDKLMAEIDAVVAGFGRSASSDTLARLFTHLAHHLDAHLALEDERVLPLFEQHFDVVEYEALEKQALESLGIGKQAAFTVPFLIGAQPPDERAALLAGSPFAFRMLHVLTRGGHARLERTVFGDVVAIDPSATVAS